jgi:hypothetical protein
VAGSIGNKGASNSRPANGIRGASRSKDPAGAANDVDNDGAVNPETFRSGSSAATRFSISSRVCFSRCRRRSNSSATRAWMCNSRDLARDESVYSSN